MDETKWLTESQERAWRALQYMQMRLTAQLARELAAASGLTYQDYVVLVALTDQLDGKLRLFELSEHLGWERSRLSHHIARMAERGLVVKQKCNSDRRGSFVAITDKGRAEIEVAAPSHAASVRRLFVDALSPDQLEAIGEASSVVLEHLNVGTDHSLN